MLQWKQIATLTLQTHLKKKKKSGKQGQKMNETNRRERNVILMSKIFLQGMFLFLIYSNSFTRNKGFFQILLGYLSSITECIILKD